MFQELLGFQGQSMLRKSGLLLLCCHSLLLLAPSVAAGGTILVAHPPVLFLPPFLLPSVLREMLLFCSARSSLQDKLFSPLSLSLPLSACLLLQPDGLYSPTLHIGTFSNLCLDNALIWPAGGQVCNQPLGDGKCSHVVEDGCGT